MTNFGCFQPVRFQLNHASAKQSGSGYASREYSVWVSGLSQEVDQEQLAKTFRTRFGSVKSVKGINTYMAHLWIY